MEDERDRMNRCIALINALEFRGGMFVAAVGPHMIRHQTIQSVEDARMMRQYGGSAPGPRTMWLYKESSRGAPKCYAERCGYEADFRLTRVRGLFRRPFERFACVDHVKAARLELGRTPGTRSR